MKKLMLLFLAVCCFFTSNLSAQLPKLDYSFVNIKNGISNVAISTIIQDQYGIIWMGTNGTGLIRYDGIDHISYKHKLNDTSSISNSLVNCAKVDSKNRIWVGTEEGLNLYNQDLDQFKKISLGNIKRTNASIRSIEQDSLGNLYVGTYGQGLFRLNLESFEVEKVSNSNLNNQSVIININCIQLAGSGRVFVGTNLGLKEVDIETNSLVDSVINDGEKNVPIDSFIETMLVDKENNLWVGTLSEGIYKFRIGNGRNKLIEPKHYTISDKMIMSMVQLEDETLMIGTENDGLFHLETSGKVIKNYLINKQDEKSIHSNSIWSLFIDTNKRIWMGYYNSGVAVSDNLYDKFRNIESLSRNPNSLKANSVMGIVKDKSERLWIGMDGGGIDIYNPKTDKYTHINKVDNYPYSGLTSDYIETIFIDSKENIWAGSWDSGIFLLKKGHTKFINYNVNNTKGKLTSNTILTISEDPNGTIWIGTFFKGLHSFDPVSKEITHYKSKPFVENGITTSDVRKVLIDTESNIWLGTTKGLFRIKKLPNGQFSIVSMEKRLSAKYGNYASANHILSLHLGTDNILWIGTRGAGLCKYNINNDELEWYNRLSGLQEENVAGIIQSKEGDLWLTGNEGISKLDRKSNTFINYTVNDGLLSNDFNFNAALRDKEGILYFGNYKGVDYFNPKDIKINNSVPSLYLVGFKLFNESVLPYQKNSPLKKVIAETESIILDNSQSVFTIEFAAINYTRPEKNQYAYYLEGLESSWNYVGNLRSATYTHLNHGEYVFKLKAANNDGIWNEVPLSLSIKILPPWWKTTWAFLTYFALLLLIIYLFNSIIQNRIREKRVIANERDKRLQEEDLNDKKFQFFTNISHEFRTPLTLILSPLANLLNDKVADLSGNVKDKLQIIEKNAKRLSRLTNELMDFRKLEQHKLKIKANKINLISFCEDIVSYFKEEATRRNIYLNVDADVLELDLWADKNMLEKIIFNILSNAFKVTPEGGAITLEISMRDANAVEQLNNNLTIKEYVMISVADTGPGLEQEQLTKIFERFYQVDNLNKAYYGGTGIGLEVVQSFVRLHHGVIDVESEIGSGTTFKVLLPFGKEHLDKSELAIVGEPEVFVRNKQPFLKQGSEEHSKIELEDKIIKTDTLLIVEDNVELRDYLRGELKEYYKIIVANNGVEGLKLAHENLPDIIITDIIMPEMDGLEFCKKIKSDIRTSHIPILVLTAKSKLDDRIESVEIGADAYMKKPFDMRLVKLRLAQLIHSRKLIFNKYFSEISGAEENKNATSIDKEFIQKILTYINDNISDSNLSVEILASQLNLSRSQLYRKVKMLTGQTVNEFIRNIRLQRANQLLESGSATISEICYQVGFASPSYFTKCFKAHFGILPTEVKVK
ncbi:response regulator [Aureibaculum sp. A20]|uniref:histidine kinase n=1 Tax=Aureibaculum flavum TaxID=2795986 RepID=A0ABS0WNN9_9FLAO|nr:response regulator [Aureibaculum flavum]